MCKLKKKWSVYVALKRFRTSEFLSIYSLKYKWWYLPSRQRMARNSGTKFGNEYIKAWLCLSHAAFELLKKSWGILSLIISGLNTACYRSDLNIYPVHCFPSSSRIFHLITYVGTFWPRRCKNTSFIQLFHAFYISISRFWTMDIHRRKEWLGQ